MYWGECSAYSITASSMKKLQELLKDDQVDFESLENGQKSAYVLQLWESKFDELINLVNENYNYCRHVGNTKTQIYYDSLGNTKT